MPFKRASIFVRFESTQGTRWPRYARQAPVTRPTYPVPMTVICMALKISGETPASAALNCFTKRKLRSRLENHLEQLNYPLPTVAVLGGVTGAEGYGTGLSFTPSFFMLFIKAQAV